MLKAQNGRLFEAFIVSASTALSDGTLMPVMVFCFAPEDANVMQYKPVPDFSFPDPQKLKNHKGNDSKEAGESFSFVLTDSDSTRLYGFCRRYSTPAGPEVACILTRHPWYNVFCKMLAAVEAIASGVKGVYGVAALMKKIQGVGMPLPGHTVRVLMEDIHPTVHELVIERPVNTSCCRYDHRLCVLFKNMPISKVVMLFFLMLTERRIILLSNNPATLSDCAHALTSLLYPFEWQHIYVPILVPKMLDYVCAPMPFIIGMHISMLPKLKGMPMEEVVMVDLDKGRLRYNEKDIQHLPDEHFDAMVNALAKCVANMSGKDADWAPISSVFLDFFLCVFSSYRRYVKHKDGVASFDKEAFARSHRKNIAKFLAEFERSQMYEVLVRKRTQASFMDQEFADDPFELSIFSIHGPSGKGSFDDSFGDRELDKEEERRGKEEEKKSRMSMRGLFNSMRDELNEMASRQRTTVYKPMYLKDEKGYVKGNHMLVKVFIDAGLLPDPSSSATQDKPSGEVHVDATPWKEEWFGPSATRWAMHVQNGKSNNSLDWTEEELEKQTKFFQELNDQRRAADSMLSGPLPSSREGSPPEEPRESGHKAAEAAEEEPEQGHDPGHQQEALLIDLSSGKGNTSMAHEQKEGEQEEEGSLLKDLLGLSIANGHVHVFAQPHPPFEWALDSIKAPYSPLGQHEEGGSVAAQHAGWGEESVSVGWNGTGEGEGLSGPVLPNAEMPALLPLVEPLLSDEGKRLVASGESCGLVQ